MKKILIALLISMPLLASATSSATSPVHYYVTFHNTSNYEIGIQADKIQCISSIYFRGEIDDTSYILVHRNGGSTGPVEIVDKDKFWERCSNTPKLARFRVFTNPGNDSQLLQSIEFKHSIFGGFFSKDWMTLISITPNSPDILGIRATCINVGGETFNALNCLGSSDEDGYRSNNDQNIDIYFENK